MTGSAQGNAEIAAKGRVGLHYLQIAILDRDGAGHRVEKMLEFALGAGEFLLQSAHLRNVHGHLKEKLQITQFPEAERDKLVKASEPIWQQWAKDQDKEGRPGTEILNFVKGEVAKTKATAQKK